MSSNSSARLRRSAVLAPLISSEKVMFSHTFISGNSARFWKISAVGRLLGPIPFMSLPPIRTRPSDGSRNPDTARRIVVFPQPDGPRNEKKLPPSMATFASRTATKIAEPDPQVLKIDTDPLHSSAVPPLPCAFRPIPGRRALVCHANYPGPVTGPGFGKARVRRS